MIKTLNGVFPDNPIEEKNMRKLTRRELLKVSLGTMGALALANLPNWNKPALRVGVLPAHAQASINNNDLRAVLTWDKGLTAPAGKDGKAVAEPSAVDIDLFVWEPDGTLVYYGRMSGPTATLDIDNIWGFGPETTYVQQGMAAAGRYWIGAMVGFYIPPEMYPVKVTLRVKSFENMPNQQSETFNFTINLPTKPEAPQVQFPIATVDFPSGDINPWTYALEFKWPTGKK
jgi:hypothetical protein